MREKMKKINENFLEKKYWKWESREKHFVGSAQHLNSRYLPDSLKTPHAVYLVPLFVLSCHFQAHIFRYTENCCLRFFHARKGSSKQLRCEWKLRVGELELTSVIIFPMIQRLLTSIWPKNCQIIKLRDQRNEKSRRLCHSSRQQTSKSSQRDKTIILIASANPWERAQQIWSFSNSRSETRAAIFPIYVCVGLLGKLFLVFLSEITNRAQLGIFRRQKWSFLRRWVWCVQEKFLL